MKKRLTLVAAVVLLLTTVFVLPLTSVVREQEDDKTIYKSSLTIKGKNNTESNTEIVSKDKKSTVPYNSSDIVNITVELTVSCLAEEFQKSSSKDLPSFLATKKAKNILENIKKEQDSFKTALAQVVGNKTEAFKTTAVAMNSVSFSCTYGKLAKIKKMQNVKHAYTSVTLTPFTSSEDADATNYSDKNNEPMEQTSNEQKEFTGAGTVTAILDTGFDIDHDALSINSESEKYSQDQFMDLIATLTPCIEGDFTQTELYNNQKVLFSYDYWDNDKDASTEISSHGTMTAGIAAGNPENISLPSNAYDSQLLLMKCSSDTSEITDSITILLAIEDSLKLGADVINIGYGNNKHLDTELSQSFDEMFERIFKSGTAIVMPSGNSGKNSFTEDGENNTDIIDDGTASSLSSLSGVLAVSEAEDAKNYSNYFVCEGNKIVYSLPKYSDGTHDYSFHKIPDSNYDYIIISKSDSEESYKKNNINGKIVFLSSNSDTGKKINSAAENGAVAVVIFGDSTQILSEKSKIPCAFAADADLSSLGKSGKLTLSSEYILEAKNENAGKISETASFGVNGVLSINPEITEISPYYSSILNNRYGTAEGSSFASALATGKIAVLKQYINSDERFSEYTPAQKNSLIYSLILGTADIITDDNIPENIRVQGSGLLNLEKAIRSGAFITVNDGLPKFELGSSRDGEYTSTFGITNISDSDISFILSSSLLTESFDEESNKSLHTEIPTADLLTQFSIDGKSIDEVTVKAGETVNISLKIKLNPLFILNKLSIYKNGIYLDGYISAASTDGISLTAPLLGFIGDYNTQSAFDSFIYDDNDPLTGILSYIYLAENNDQNNNAAILGYNKFLKKYDENNISFNSKTLSAITGNRTASDVSLYLRSIATRNITDFKCTVKNENDSVIFETEPFNRDKFSYGDEITSINTELTSLSDGKYTITISGKIEDLPNVFHEQSRTFKFTVDSKKPNNTSYRTYYSDDKTYLEIVGKDNNAIQGFDIYAAVYNGKTGKYEYSDSLFDLMRDSDIPIYGDTIVLIENHVTDNGSTVFTYDITKLKSMLKRLAKSYNDKDSDLKISENKVAFAAVDYAYNHSEIKLCDTVVYDDLTLEFVDKDGTPISNVSVEINKREFTSDENGKITYANLPAGDYKVKLTKIPNKLCIKENPFTVTVGESTDKLNKIVTLMPEGTYKNSSDNSASPSQSPNKSRDPEQKPGKELNPTEPQPEDASSSIYALIFVASLLAISIAAFLISKKKFL